MVSARKLRAKAEVASRRRLIGFVSSRLQSANGSPSAAEEMPDRESRDAATRYQFCRECSINALFVMMFLRILGRLAALSAS